MSAEYLDEANNVYRAVTSLAIVTAFYPPDLGGIERYTQGFARAASALGIRVVVLTTRCGFKTVFEEDAGVHVVRLPALHVPVLGSHFPIPIKDFKVASQALNVDMVLAQTRFFPTTLMAAAICALRKKRIYVIEHGAGPLRTSEPFASLSMIYERCVSRTLMYFNPRFLGVSKAALSWLGGFGVNDAALLPNGVEARDRPMRRMVWRNRCTVFYAGRLFNEKGILSLIRAIEALRTSGRAVELRVAGAGPLAPQLKRYASASAWFAFLGQLSRQEVESELDRADVFVNPSTLAEGLPTILLEAGRAALPVVSTSGGGSAELIREGDTGWILKGATPEEIASALSTVLEEPEEALRRGANLFREVMAQYTWPTIVKVFLDSTHVPYDGQA